LINCVSCKQVSGERTINKNPAKVQH
jgi:hypothetical protein